MNPDYSWIEERMQRFFEGESSNEEERELYALFSSESLPEHLLPYRPIFAYFETGIKDEPKHQKIVHKSKPLNKRIWVGIAASLLLFTPLLIYHYTRQNDLALFEGSYLIINGVKITDPRIVVPEAKKSLYLAQQLEEEFNLLLQSIDEMVLEDPYDLAIKEIRQQQLVWAEQIEDEMIRNELIEIINNNL